MKKNNQIAKAVALALTGTALSFGMNAANATPLTMYNLSSSKSQQAANTQSVDPAAGGVWTSNFTGGTDGWTNGAYPSNATGTVATQGWVGTASSSTAAFGYTGAHMNWGVDFGNDTRGSTATISTYDAKANYGVYADIDTAKGAWAATNTGAQQGGWRHDLDVGLFRANNDVTVTLNISGIINTNAEFGFTIFKGMDAVTKYGHHGGWNAGNNTGGITSASSPYTGGVQAGTGLSTSDIVAYTVGTLDGGVTPTSNTISFKAQAGQLYTIFLGGYMDGGWSTTTDGYILKISAVPEPSSLLLIGAAAAGFRATRRKSLALAS